MFHFSALFYYFVSGVSLIYLFNRWHKKTGPPMPPGPKRYPIIGGLLSFPKHHSWLEFAKHKSLYGPISSISVFGQNFVLLNDRETAFEILDGRSAIYSDRPEFTFATMCGMTANMPLAHYGNDYKSQRKATQLAFGSSNSVLPMLPVVEAEMRRFLLNAITAPDEVNQHIDSAAGAIILKVIYGYSVETKEPDPLVKEVEDAIKLIMIALQPVSWRVDSFPILRHMPEWLPGSGFKKTAKKYHKEIINYVERPYLFVKQQMAAGVAHPSYISTLIEQIGHELDPYLEFVFKRSAASMYGAGLDTTLSQLYSFILAMVLYPEVQKKAQAEIDAVVGIDRLPTISDRDELPYVEAIFKEVRRWHTAVPLALPHVAIEDDIYNGYLIPKGSIVLPNIWLYNHDPVTYHDPFTFKPERFLGNNPEINPETTIFGFGRRKCAGRRLAELSVYTAVVMSLATLNIGKARDVDGNEITPIYNRRETTDEVVSHVKPFKCSVTPRSETARELIMSIENDYDFAHSDAEALRKVSLEIDELKAAKNIQEFPVRVSENVG